MTTNIIKGLGGTCQACCWNLSATCPPALAVGESNGTGSVAVAFNGGAKVGSGCAGTDPYVSIFSTTTIAVDVWAAYRAGAWTSSVTILVYAISPSVTGFARANSDARFSNCAGVAKAHGIIPGSGCPTTMVGTITLLDDGTYTIA